MTFVSANSAIMSNTWLEMILLYLSLVLQLSHLTMNLILTSNISPISPRHLMAQRAEVVLVIAKARAGAFPHREGRFRVGFSSNVVRVDNTF